MEQLKENPRSRFDLAIRDRDHDSWGGRSGYRSGFSLGPAKIFLYYSIFKEAKQATTFKGKQMKEKTRQCRENFGHKGQGPSSYWMQEPEQVFESLDICPGQHILDIGCGAGDYTFQAARLVGPSGLVIALDHWPPIVTALEASASAAGLSQVQCFSADIREPPLPVQDNSIDLCMAFTVLHIFGQDRHKQALFRETARVLKSQGHLAVIECKKEKMSFGPPVHMRLSPEEVEATAMECGFQKIAYIDLGYNYLILFSFSLS